MALLYRGMIWRLMDRCPERPWTNVPLIRTLGVLSHGVLVRTHLEPAGLLVPPTTQEFIRSQAWLNHLFGRNLWLSNRPLERGPPREVALKLQQISVLFSSWLPVDESPPGRSAGLFLSREPDFLEPVGQQPTRQEISMKMSPGFAEYS